MGEMIQLAEVILSSASRRLDVAAENIANITTPAYKARIPFDHYISGSEMESVRAGRGEALDWSDGRVVKTGNELDLAISGDGYFVVRSGDALFYTRNGQFQRDADGRIVSSDGMILQANGGDATVKPGAIALDAGGVIRQDGKDVGQVAVVTFKDRSVLKAAGGGRFGAPADAAVAASAPRVVQGALEQSNTSGATEMLAMMAALRRAETGQHVVQLYDDLMTQAANSFGQGRG